MNSFYDADNARHYLHAFLVHATQEYTAIPIYHHLLSIDLDEVHVERHPEVNNRMPRLTLSDGEGGFQEVCVRVPGILCKKLLPPVLRPLSGDHPHMVRQLKQSVKLTGLGLEEFAEFDAVISRMLSVFRRELGEDTVQDYFCKPYEGHLAYDMSCRYFTDREDAPTQGHVPFTSAEDPKYLLEMARKQRFIRCEDNVVQYCIRTGGIDGPISYKSARPEAFKEGDIVEAHVAFTAWPTQDSRYQFGLTLRALALVESRYREESCAKLQGEVERYRHSQKREGKIAGHVNVKRQRIVYDDDVV